MRRQRLGQTEIEVSRLGFGCVKLTTHHERRDAVRILEHAFELGITHFDVARAYGFGQAEGILGEFLSGKRERVTVTTKFGIEPPAGLAGKRWLVNIAKRMLRPFPQLLRRTQQAGGKMARSHVFSPEAAVRSLEISLRELKTDYVDLWLLHEATLAEAGSEPLVETLHRQIARGTVRAVGVGSEFAKLNAEGMLDPIYQAVQFDDNAAVRNLPAIAQRAGRALITHSIFKPVTLLMAAIDAQNVIVNKYSSLLQSNLADRSAVAAFLLQYALRSNSAGMILFSSNSSMRIAQNVRDAESREDTAEQTSLFVQFVDEVLAAHNPGTSTDPAAVSVPNRAT